MYTETKYKSYGTNEYSKLSNPENIESKFKQVEFDFSSLEGKIITDNNELRRQAIEIVLEKIKTELEKYGKDN